jgi:hypothetical protein
MNGRKVEDGSGGARLEDGTAYHEAQANQRRRPPQLPMGEAKAPQHRRKEVFNDYAYYSEWLQVADAVSEAPQSIATVAVTRLLTLSGLCLRADAANVQRVQRVTCR